MRQRLPSKGRNDLHGSGHPGVLIDTVEHGCEMLNVHVLIHISTILYYLCFYYTFLSASGEVFHFLCQH